jgi:hypothetical protein
MTRDTSNAKLMDTSRLVSPASLPDVYWLFPESFGGWNELLELRLGHVIGQKWSQCMGCLVRYHPVTVITLLSQVACSIHFSFPLCVLHAQSFPCVLMTPSFTITECCCSLNTSRWCSTVGSAWVLHGFYSENDVVWLYVESVLSESSMYWAVLLYECVRVLNATLSATEEIRVLGIVLQAGYTVTWMFSVSKYSYRLWFSPWTWRRYIPPKHW